jgi:hypothetical protein
LQKAVVLALREIVPTLCRLRLLRLAASGKVIVETKENTMTDEKIYAAYRAKEARESAAISAKCGNHCNAFFFMQRAKALNEYSQSLTINCQPKLENTMTTTLSIHDATKITTRGVMHSNSNAITLQIETNGHFGNLQHEVTLFDLPTHIADALENLLGEGGVKPELNESDIRADERRKINARIRESIDPIF